MYVGSRGRKSTRADFRPAALVADGCLRLLPANLGGDDAGCDVSDEEEADDLGFICMILRARLGGGDISYWGMVALSEDL